MGRGRRPGGSGTRDEILAAARKLFAENGYDATSLRAIARAAGVDPALVHHYFDGKDALFAEVLEPPFNPGVIVQAAFDGDPDRVGERLIRAFLAVFQNEDTMQQMLTIMRSAATSPRVAARMAELIDDYVLARLRKQIGSAARPGDLRGSLAASQMIGLGLTRYVLKLPPLVALSDDDLVALVAPTLQRYLTEDLL